MVSGLEYRVYSFGFGYPYSNQGLQFMINRLTSGLGSRVSGLRFYG